MNLSRHDPTASAFLIQEVLLSSLLYVDVICKILLDKNTLLLEKKLQISD